MRRTRFDRGNAEPAAPFRPIDTGFGAPTITMQPPRTRITASGAERPITEPFGFEAQDAERRRREEIRSAVLARMLAAAPMQGPLDPETARLESIDRGSPGQGNLFQQVLTYDDPFLKGVAKPASGRLLRRIGSQVGYRLGAVMPTDPAVLRGEESPTHNAERGREIGGAVGEFVGEGLVPTSGWQQIMELLPGIGTVPGGISMVKKGLPRLLALEGLDLSPAGLRALLTRNTSDEIMAKLSSEAGGNEGARIRELRSLISRGETEFDQAVGQDARRLIASQLEVNRNELSRLEHAPLPGQSDMFGGVAEAPAEPAPREVAPQGDMFAAPLDADAARAAREAPAAPPAQAELATVPTSSLRFRPSAFQGRDRTRLPAGTKLSMRVVDEAGKVHEAGSIVPEGGLTLGYGTKRVDELREVLRSGKKFGPIKVVANPDEPGTHVVYSGHHRAGAYVAEGVEQVPVEINPADIRNADELAATQGAARTENYKTAPTNVRERARDFGFFADQGEDVETIAARFRAKPSEVQQILDARRLGEQAVDRALADKGALGVAGELGRGMRVYGISSEDANALFKRFLNPDEGGKIPSVTAVRQTVDMLGKEMQKPGAVEFAGFAGMGGENSGAVKLLNEYTAKQAELEKQVKSVQSLQRQVKKFTASNPKALPHARGLLREAKKDEARLTKDLAKLKRGAMRELRQAPVEPSAAQGPKPLRADSSGEIRRPPNKIESIVSPGRTQDRVAGSNLSDASPPSDVTTMRPTTPSTSTGPVKIEPGTSAGAAVSEPGAAVGVAGDRSLVIRSSASGYQPDLPADKLTALAHEHAAGVDDALKKSLNGIPGAHMDLPGANLGTDIKSAWPGGWRRIAEKLTTRRADQIGDYLRARVALDDEASLLQAMDAIEQDFTVHSIDSFLDNPKGPYRAVHMQVEAPGAGGFTFELQLVPRPIAEIQESPLLHGLHVKWRSVTMTPELAKARAAEYMTNQKIATEVFNAWPREQGARGVLHTYSGAQLQTAARREGVGLVWKPSDLGPGFEQFDREATIKALLERRGANTPTGEPGGSGSGSVPSPDAPKAEPVGAGMEPPGPARPAAAAASVPPASESARSGNRFAGALRAFDDVRREVVTSASTAVRALVGVTGINPSLMDDTPVGKVLTAYARQRVAAEELGRLATSAAMDTHAQRFTGRRAVLSIDGTGRIRGLRAEPGQSTVWQDVFSRPGDYTLTPAQRSYIDDFHTVIDEIEQLRVDAGLRPLAKRGKEGWLYVPRQVEGIRGIELRRPSSGKLQRIYEEAQDGVARGVRYDRDPRATLDLHVRAAYREMADKQLSDALEPLSLTAKDLIPKPVVTRLEAAIKTRRALEADVRRLRFQVGATQDVPKARGKLAALEDARGKLATARREHAAARFAYARRMEAARKAEVSPGALWGPNQPETIAIGHWRNRIFPRDQADRLTETLASFGKTGQKQGWLAKGVEILGNETRFLASVGDFAAPFIQGLPILFRHPAIWGKASLAHYQAFVDPTVSARLLREYMPEFREMAAHGTPIGDAEFFRALREGGGFSPGKMLELAPKGAEVRGFMQNAGKQSFGRFEASYNTLVASSRAQLTRALKDSVPKAADRQQIIRNLTGGLDTRALGVGPDQRAFESLWLAFSPRLLRSTVALVKDATRGPGDAIGREALTSLGSLAAGVTGVYVATGLALGKDWEEIGAGLNPLNGKRFLSHEVNGDWIGIGGQIRALTQLAAGLTVGQYKDVREGKRPGVLTLNRFDNPLLAFATGRGAPGQNIAATTIEGLSGGDADAQPFSKVDGPIDIFKQIGTSAIPFAIQGVLEGQQPLSVGASLVGARTSAGTYSETPEGKQKLDQKREAASVKSVLKDAGMPDPAKAFQSDAWRAYFRDNGFTLDLKPYKTISDLHEAYLQRAGTQISKRDGISLERAKDLADREWARLPAVRAFDDSVKKARLTFWRAHPDLLQQAFDADAEELNGDERKILDQYEAQQKANGGVGVPVTAP